MLSRCRNPQNPSWQYYGGKGIAVCPEWQSFGPFFAYIGPAPSPEHQIDRADNEADYAPGNVYWSTPAEQQLNTSKVVFLTVMGVHLPAQKWAELFGLPGSTLHARIVQGWSAEDAVRTPINHALRPRKRYSKGGSLKKVMRERRDALQG